MPASPPTAPNSRVTNDIDAAFEDRTRRPVYMRLINPTYFQIGVSWGAHESLIYAQAISYLKELPPDRFKDVGISLGDMRISVGLENAEDLIQDLAGTLEQMES